MATISNTPRPGYVWDSTDNVWYPIGVGAHQHTNAADTPAVMPYSTYAAAGKNKILNGDFAINQRNFTTDSVGGYGFDRFTCAFSGATATATAQTFTLGTAPVTGYEAKNFLRLAVTTGNDYCRVVQPVESVRTFAGQTATLSFWAKGTNPTTAGNLKTSIVQNFGTGGSPSTQIRSAEQTFVLTANWTRYSFTFVVPSIAGKTIGTDNNDRFEVEIGQQSNTSTDSWTLDLWGVQLEAGSTVTAFQTATGNPASELAACQRYYYRSTPGTTYGHQGSGYAYQTDRAVFTVNFPVTMRTVPASVEYSGLAIDQYGVTQFAFTTLSLTSSTKTQDSCIVETGGSTGLTQYRPYALMGANNAANYIGFSAEL